jgi:Ras-related GTP-binding protein A/B
MENYLSSQRDHIFRNVQVLIYVFDVESRDWDRDVFYYRQCLEAMQQNSNDAKIFCLVHKMDLITEEQRDFVFKQKESELRSVSMPQKINVFRTSIWDETLYRAWSSIVYALIPNVKVVESRLEKFCRICEADEVVLFEKATFLVISHATRGASSSSSSSDKSQQIASKEAPSSAVATPDTSALAPASAELDPHRFEKISNIIKQFKLSCSKSQAQFSSMEVRNSKFSAFIAEFTTNTYVMVITSDASIQSTATLVNIKIAKRHFDPFMSANQSGN